MFGYYSSKNIQSFYVEGKREGKSIQQGSYDMKGRSHKLIAVLIYFLTAFFPGPPIILWAVELFPMTVFLYLMGEQRVNRPSKQCHRRMF